MQKETFSWKKIPGWVVMLVVFGGLYLTGLHTEAIGQVQRLLLASGLKNAEMPSVETPASFTSTSAQKNAAMAGTGFKMVDLEGKIVNFESLKGKVVFLNIWATWCPPCLAEMPNIQSLYEKVGSDKIAFVMLSVDQGGQKKVKRFIEKKGFTFPVYQPASEMPMEFRSNGIPTTFVISPSGKIVAQQEGMAEYDTQEVRDYLQKLARQK